MNQSGVSFPLSEIPVKRIGGHLDIGAKRVGLADQLGWYRE